MDGDVLVLIKPQFEAGRSNVLEKKGIVSDPKVHQDVLEENFRILRTNWFFC